MQQTVDQLAQTIWDYHHMGHHLEPADCILVLGSHDLRVAERGAQIFLENWAPLMIFAGGQGRLTETWDRPEAERFAEIAIGMGVPADRILTESRSTNTGENMILTQQLLAANGLDPQRFILVQKPYMERRAYATFRRYWPTMPVVVTSPQISFAEYPNHEISRDDVINIMLGDLQRIKLYAERGFQIPQPIPDQVWAAFEELCVRGYTRQLIA